MLDFFRRLFASDFMPHGHCYFWRPELVWLHAVSDGLIALSYYSIPVVLFFVVRRHLTRMRVVLLMFAGFILACGTTHVLSIWDLWHSAYRLEGAVKAVTAILSVATAIVAIRLAPLAMRLPTPEALQSANESLRLEIEARKEAERKLQGLLEAERMAGEEKVRSYFEAASQAIIAVSGDGKIVLVNQRTEELFGYHRSELLGRELEMLLPERYRSAHMFHRGGYFHAPRVRPIGGGLDLAGLHKDGTELPLEIGLSFVNSEEGTLALALISDISERKRSADELRQANASLKAQEAQLRSFLEAASQGILAIDQRGRIVLVNGRTEEMFGYSRQELVGQELEILLPGRYRTGHVAHRAIFFDEPRVRPMGAGMDLSGRRKDGSEFPVDIGLSFVETAQGKVAMGLISDITERKLAADRLVQAADDLRRSNAELEQFAYVASHDLQEPLRMVTGYLNILQRRYSTRLDSDAEEFIRYAVDGAARMKGMIREILSLSRVGTQAINLMSTPAVEVVRCAVDNLTAAISESGAEIECDPLPSVFADPGLLTLVFQNVIGNAIKFRGSQTPKVHIAAVARGRDWLFSINDNGIGIHSEHIDRIFRIFERLHGSETYPGTGVGLAIAKKIVERHGGRIWVESIPGQGSTFYFQIPSVPDPFE